MTEETQIGGSYQPEQMVYNHEPPGIRVTFKTPAEADALMTDGANDAAKLRVSECVVVLKLPTTSEK